LYFAKCFATKQTAENEKEFYDLQFCGVLWGNKRALYMCVSVSPNILSICTHSLNIFQ